MSTMNRVKSEFIRCLGDKLTQVEAELFQLIDCKEVKFVKEHLVTYKDEIDFHKKGDMGYTALQAAVLAKNKHILAALLATRKCEPIDDALVLATQVRYQAGINVFLKYINLSSMTTVGEDSMEEILVSDGYGPASAAVTMPPQLQTQKCAFVFPGLDRVERFGPPENRQSNVFHDPLEILKNAAISEDFKMTETLINSNLRLEEPTVNGSFRGHDTLRESVQRIDTFRALCSATYISLTAEDPIKIAFERSSQFVHLSDTYPENREDFKLLAEKSSRFAVALLGLCSSSDEVRQLLQLKPSSFSPFADHKFGRLMTAVSCNQKSFVTHTYCQHILTSLWLDGLPEWQQWSSFRRTIHILLQAILMPFMSMLTLVAPHHYLAAPAKVPLNRFLYAATSYSIFVILLFSILASSSSGSYSTSWIHCFTFMFTLATWVRVLAYDLPFKGKHYFKSFWNVYEFAMYSIFTVAFIFVLFLQDVHSVFLALGEGLMAIGFILALTRTLQWLQLHQSLGPFIIAFNKIIQSLSKLVIVLVILCCAFSIGIYFLYRNKTTMISAGDDPHFLFTRYSGVVGALFWSVYGYGEYDYPRIVPVENSTNVIHDVPTTEEITEWVGFGLWGLFHIACVTIVTNMLIALMTNTYQKIEDHCDNEWKYARTEFWMYYFEDLNRIPVPFNVLDFLKIMVQWTFNKLLKKNVRIKTSTPWTHNETDNSMEIRIDMSNVYPLELVQTDPTEYDEYSNLMKILVERYFKKSDLEQKST